MKRLYAVVLAAALLLTACGNTPTPESSSAAEAPVAQAPAEGPSTEEVIDLLHIAESIYHPGNFDTLSAVSQENYINGLYYDEVDGYKEITSEFFTQDAVEQLEKTVFLEIPLIYKETDRVYRASAMSDAAFTIYYEIIDGVSLVAEDSGNYFYEITHVPLPRWYTEDDRAKLSSLVSPLTIVWEDGRWKVDNFAAFGQNAIASGTPLAPDEIEDKGQLPGHIAALPEPYALTEEEIAQVNAAFEPIVNQEVNPLGLFLMSWYSSPTELNLTDFLRYFPGSEDVTNAAEFEALKAHENWSWPKDAKLDMMPVPIHRIEAARVEALLQQYMGCGIGDITYHPSSELIYLEEYDCYYNFTSDAGFGMFTCVSGDITGDTLTLTGTDSILTMKRKGETWLFHSFMPSFSSQYQP